MLVVLVLSLIVVIGLVPVALRVCSISLSGLVVMLRARLNLHRLKDLHDAMLHVAFEHQVSGLRQDYLPNRLVYGWHPNDMARWSQLSREIAAETELLIGARARADGTFLAGEVSVTIVEDPAARPGRPTLKASTCRDAERTVLLHEHEREPATLALVTRTLLVHRPDGTSERIPLRDGLTVGRRPDAGLRIAAETVSAEHARFTVDATRAHVIDLASSNGTYVNGRRIEGETALETGDVVAFGDAANRVQLDAR